MLGTGQDDRKDRSIRKPEIVVSFEYIIQQEVGTYGTERSRGCAC